MTTTQNTAAARTTLIRRIAAGAVLAAAPALLALGTATASQADTAVPNPGPSVSAPAHPAFPHQTNMPQPGTPIHHHHQKSHTN